MEKRRLSPDASFLRLWFLWTVIYRVSRTPSDSLTMPWFRGQETGFEISISPLSLFLSLFSLYYSNSFKDENLCFWRRPLPWSSTRQFFHLFNRKMFRVIFARLDLIIWLTTVRTCLVWRIEAFRLIFRRSRCGYSLNVRRNDESVVAAPVNNPAKFY